MSDRVAHVCSRDLYTFWLKELAIGWGRPGPALLQRVYDSLRLTTRTYVSTYE